MVQDTPAEPLPLSSASDMRPSSEAVVSPLRITSVVKFRYAELTPMSLRSNHVDPPNPKIAGERKRRCQALPGVAVFRYWRISSGLDTAMRIRF